MGQFQIILNECYGFIKSLEQLMSVKLLFNTLIIKQKFIIFAASEALFNIKYNRLSVWN